jgi:hypothetical protein
MTERATWVAASQSPVVPGTGIHAMALTPVVLWTVWWSWMTFAITVLVAVVFVVLQVKGRTPSWVVARQKSRLRGQQVAAQHLWYLRRRSRLHTYAQVDPASAWFERPTSSSSGSQGAASANNKGKGKNT